jgi:hypothetical protein
MPWTYPPPYTLFVQGLAYLPIGVAYVLFIVATLTFYLLVLRRIAGEFLPGVLIAILPTILITVRTGQNGFLTGGLIGCFLLTFIAKRPVAGVPLGLMVIKPHLAVGISLVTLLGARWNAAAIAAGIVLAALLAATVAFGAGIWPAFLGGVREAGAFLSQGFYPMFRMTSIYALVWTSGGPPSLAFAFQAGGAVCALGLLWYVWQKQYEPRFLAAAVCMASLFVSPYNYDYDLTLLGPGIAFIIPDLLQRARIWELMGLLCLSWFANGYVFFLLVFLSDANTGLHTEGLWAISGIGMILLTLAACRVLRRHSGNVLPAAGEVRTQD